MYLSRLLVDPVNRKAHYCLADQYAFHTVLHAAFDADEPPAVLYRIEPERHEGLVHVIVQSVLPPSWTRSGFAGRLPVREIEGPKHVTLGLEKGQVLRFRLRANPTQFVQGKKRVRTGIVREVNQTEWLRRRLMKGGLELHSHQIVNEGMSHIVKRSDAEKHSMSFVSILCDGFLTVSDPDLAVATVQSGIGSGKAFGFGLLSVGRAI